MSGEGVRVDGTVLVVGAALAGLRAAQALREGGFRGNIVMVGDEERLPTDRPPLSKQVLAGTWPPERAALLDAEHFGALGLDLRLARRAVAFEAPAARVTLDDGTVVEGDGVVLATGARPRRLPAEAGGDATRLLRTVDDALGLRARIDAVGPGCRVVVVGGGFIGSEVAATCAGLGCAVTVLEALPTPLASSLGERVGAALGALHVRNGVTLRTESVVEHVDTADDGTSRVVLADGDALAADVVVVGIGVVPNTEWLEGSGVEIGNGVSCDHALFAADGVVGAGDVARWRWRHHGEEEPVRIEHWEIASQMGAAAARSLLAGRRDAPAFETVPYFWSDQYGLKIQVLGRPDPADEVAVVHGSLDAAPDDPDGSRFVVVYGRRGRLTAVLAVARPRQLMAFRPLLVAGSSFEDARALLDA